MAWNGRSQPDPQSSVSGTKQSDALDLYCLDMNFSCKDSESFLVIKREPGVLPHPSDKDE